jgi:tRNA pseudouridine38-40 synthase
MARYFIEVSYKGTAYSGFQRQENAHTVQAELENAIAVLQRESIQLTGSSRTDAGVHAHQNFFHCDFEGEWHPQAVYKLNAILPADLVLRQIKLMPQEAHSRFDARSRRYRYFIYTHKNPFVADRAYYFPYRIDLDRMQEAAALLKEYKDFTSFSKRNTQVKTFDCEILESSWAQWEEGFYYEVRANRFLRGMVRALTATMLQVGRGKLTLLDFRRIIDAKDCTVASFAVPAHGLFLEEVEYPYDI